MRQETEINQHVEGIIVFNKVGSIPLILSDIDKTLVISDETGIDRFNDALSDVIKAQMCESAFLALVTHRSIQTLIDDWCQKWRVRKAWLEGLAITSTSPVDFKEGYRAFVRSIISLKQCADLFQGHEDGLHPGNRFLGISTAFDEKDKIGSYSNRVLFNFEEKLKEYFLEKIEEGDCNPPDINGDDLPRTGKFACLGQKYDAEKILAAKLAEEEEKAKKAKKAEQEHSLSAIATLPVSTASSIGTARSRKRKLKNKAQQAEEIFKAMATRFPEKKISYVAIDDHLKGLWAKVARHYPGHHINPKNNGGAYKTRQSLQEAFSADPSQQFYSILNDSQSLEMADNFSLFARNVLECQEIGDKEIRQACWLLCVSSTEQQLNVLEEKLHKNQSPSAVEIYKQFQPVRQLIQQQNASLKALHKKYQESREAGCLLDINYIFTCFQLYAKEQSSEAVHHLIRAMKKDKPILWDIVQANFSFLSEEKRSTKLGRILAEEVYLHEYLEHEKINYLNYLNNLNDLNVGNVHRAMEQAFGNLVSRERLKEVYEACLICLEDDPSYDEKVVALLRAISCTKVDSSLPFIGVVNHRLYMCSKNTSYKMYRYEGAAFECFGVFDVALFLKENSAQQVIYQRMLNTAREIDLDLQEAMPAPLYDALLSPFNSLLRSSMLSLNYDKNPHATRSLLEAMSLIMTIDQNGVYQERMSKLIKFFFESWIKQPLHYTRELADFKVLILACETVCYIDLINGFKTEMKEVLTKNKHVIETVYCLKPYRYQEKLYQIASHQAGFLTLYSKDQQAVFCQIPDIIRQVRARKEKESTVLEAALSHPADHVEAFLALYQECNERARGSEDFLAEMAINLALQNKIPADELFVSSEERAVFSSKEEVHEELCVRGRRFINQKIADCHYHFERSIMSERTALVPRVDQMQLTAKELLKKWQDVSSLDEIHESKITLPVIEEMLRFATLKEQAFLRKLYSIKSLKDNRIYALLDAKRTEQLDSLVLLQANQFPQNAADLLRQKSTLELLPIESPIHWHNIQLILSKKIQSYTDHPLTADDMSKLSVLNEADAEQLLLPQDFIDLKQAREDYTRFKYELRIFQQASGMFNYLKELALKLKEALMRHEVIDVDELAQKMIACAEGEPNVEEIDLVILLAELANLSEHELIKKRSIELACSFINKSAQAKDEYDYIIQVVKDEGWQVALNHTLFKQVEESVFDVQLYKDKLAGFCELDPGFFTPHKEVAQHLVMRALDQFPQNAADLLNQKRALESLPAENPIHWDNIQLILSKKIHSYTDHPLTADDMSKLSVLNDVGAEQLLLPQDFTDLKQAREEYTQFQDELNTLRQVSTRLDDLFELVSKLKDKEALVRHGEDIGELASKGLPVVGKLVINTRDATRANF